jgi:hypothetical protein
MSGGAVCASCREPKPPGLAWHAGCPACHAEGAPWIYPLDLAALLGGGLPLFDRIEAASKAASNADGRAIPGVVFGYSSRGAFMLGGSPVPDASLLISYSRAGGMRIDCTYTAAGRVVGGGPEFFRSESGRVTNKTDIRRGDHA